MTLLTDLNTWRPKPFRGAGSGERGAHPLLAMRLEISAPRSRALSDATRQSFPGGWRRQRLRAAARGATGAANLSARRQNLLKKKRAATAVVDAAEAAEADAAGDTSPGRHCHSTRPLTVISCHSLGISTVFSLALLSFSVHMTVSPVARRHAGGVRSERAEPERDAQAEEADGEEELRSAAAFLLSSAPASLVLLPSLFSSDPVSSFSAPASASASASFSSSAAVAAVATPPSPPHRRGLLPTEL